MTERGPQPGDRVRVTIDYTVDPSGHYVGKSIAHEDYVTVEVLEPADDPSQSPIGEVREHPDGWVRIKARDGEWIDLGNGTVDGHVTDDVVRGAKVIGSVPGTPAAFLEAERKLDEIPEWEQELLLQEAARSREPRVFRSDGPEPPADVTVLIDSDHDPEESSFAYLIRTGDGWCWSPSAELIAPDFGPPGTWRERAGASCGTGFREVRP